MLLVGSKAPDFTLKNTHNKEVSLSDFAGKKVLLSFHPLAWTPVCSEQMKALERYIDIFDKNNCVALGISVDAVPSKSAWAKSLAIQRTILLSDFWPHGEVAKLYGIFRSGDGFSERANIIIDEGRSVIYTNKYMISEVPVMAEIMSVLGTSAEDEMATHTIQDVNPIG
jgi:peroxiredoxin